MSSTVAAGVIAALHKVEQAAEECKRIEQDSAKNEFDRLNAKSRVYEAERAFGAQWRAVKEVLEWQPIGTAPIDGTPIQLGWPEKHGTVRTQVVGYWAPPDSTHSNAIWTDGSLDGHEELQEYNPTHWKPLLPGPETPKGVDMSCRCRWNPETGCLEACPEHEAEAMDQMMEIEERRRSQKEGAI